MERLSLSVRPSASAVRPVHADLGGVSNQHCQSRLAGHVLSARDRWRPIEDARLVLDFIEAASHLEGHFEIALDALPVEVELVISAPGFHPLREVINWAPIASGGLILRDFYLTPLDMPAPAPRPVTRESISFDLPPLHGSLGGLSDEEPYEMHEAADLSYDGIELDEEEERLEELDEDLLEDDVLELEVDHSDERNWLSAWRDRVWDDDEVSGELETSLKQPVLLSRLFRSPR